MWSVARVQRHRRTDRRTRNWLEGTLSGFKEFFLQPIIKDRPNINMQGQRSNAEVSADYALPRHVMERRWVGLGGRQGKQSSLNCYVDKTLAHYVPLGPLSSYGTVQFILPNRGKSFFLQIVKMYLPPLSPFLGLFKILTKSNPCD